MSPGDFPGWPLKVAAQGDAGAVYNIDAEDSVVFDFGDVVLVGSQGLSAFDLSDADDQEDRFLGSVD